MLSAVCDLDVILRINVISDHPNFILSEEAAKSSSHWPISFFKPQYLIRRFV